MACHGYVNPWAFLNERTGDCKNCPAGHGWRGHVNWPTESHAIHPGRGFQVGHPAIDIDTSIGLPVYAAETGMVIWAGWSYYGYGNLIILDHGRGYQTLYAHLEDVEIACNTTVTRGQHIGNVGMTGQSGFPHLHFEVRENRLSCNPFIWLENGEEEEMTALQNSSFEGITRPGGWTRDTHTGQEWGEIYCPEGWTAWWKEGAFRRPEMKVIQNVPPFADPPRIQEGDWAFQAFTTFGRQHAGLYQVVPGLLPGETYELKVQAHAWSLHPGIGEQSPYCSSGVGCGAVYIPEGDAPEVDPDNPDFVSDAIGNFTFRVGVSYGDPDPLGTVDWGKGAHIYNVYHEVPPLRFVAPGDGKVTIYLCAASLWEFKNSDACWDSVTLKKVSGDTPPPQDCPGAPRVQYERTYLLMHPSADEEWVKAATEAVWDKHRYTIGGSADDAGIGALDTRNVIAVNPGEWPGNLEDFFEKYYPGLNYRPIEAATPDVLQEQLSGPFDPPSGLLLWQCNPKWKDEKVASPACSMTLCQTGCWISACAMAQRFFNISPDATPSTVNQALGGVGGFSGCMTLWSGMEKALGLEVVKRSADDVEAQEWLDTGNVCFAEVEPETFMHFVLVTKYQEGRFWMHDSYKNVEGWVDEHYPGIESWRLVRPFEPVPPPPYTLLNLINPHMQTAEAGVFAAQRVAGRSPLTQKILSLYYTWCYRRDQAATRRATFSYLRDANSNCCKVFSFEDVYGVLRADPDTIAVVRHPCTNDYGGIFIDDAELGARRWVDLSRDALYATCDYIRRNFPGIKKPFFYLEDPNELYPSHNAPLVTRAANLDRAIAYEIQRTGLPIATVGYCAGVGNPHESEFELLVPLARTLEQTGGAMGLHLYWWGNKNESGLDSWWKYHAGRYQEVDKELVKHGVHVDWLCGESGVVQSDDGYHLNALSGWRDVMSQERYVAELLEVNRRDNEWNETHGGRFKSRDVFTTCAHFCNWESFRMEQAEWEDVAAALEILWQN